MTDIQQLDTQTRTFTTADGTEFTLRPIPLLILERLHNDQWGRPQPPLVEVELGGKHKKKEANPDDPDYQLRLREWENARRMRLVKFTFVKGVEGEPDEAFVQEYRQFFPGADDMEMKYLWVCSHLGNEDETAAFSEAIVSQTMVTPGGVDEAAERFPGES